MSTSFEVKATTIANTLFGAFFLALDRLQQLPPGDGIFLGVDGTGVSEMVDPAAVECVLRHWTLGDSHSLQKICEAKGFSS
jgi:hypothetical protein